MVSGEIKIVFTNDFDNLIKNEELSLENFVLKGKVFQGTFNKAGMTSMATGLNVKNIIGFSSALHSIGREGLHVNRDSGSLNYGDTSVGWIVNGNQVMLLIATEDFMHSNIELLRDFIFSKLCSTNLTDANRVSESLKVIINLIKEQAEKTGKNKLAGLFKQIQTK